MAGGILDGESTVGGATVRTRLRSWWLVLICMGLGLACSGKPARRVPPRIDPQAAAAEAIKTLDRNGDGLLQEEELVASPGLMAARGAVDQNGDHQLAPEEIAARIASWSANRVALVSVRCVVRRGGQPLVGANVRFEPEPFLGPAIQGAGGISDASGTVAVTLDGESIPGLMHCGFFRVTISKMQGNKEWIPKKYNQETTLGEEITEGSGRRKEGIIYDL